MIRRFGFKATLSIAVGIGMFIFAELIFSEVAHIDLTGRPIAWIPILLSIVPLVMVIIKEKWDAKQFWKRLFKIIFCLLILLICDLVLLITWSCYHGVCI